MRNPLRRACPPRAVGMPPRTERKPPMPSRLPLPAVAALLLVVSLALPGTGVARQRKIVLQPLIEAEPPAPPRQTDEEVLRDAKVGADGPALVEFLRRRVAGAADEARVKGMIARLGDDAFERREEASNELVAAGARARALLA